MCQQILSEIHKDFDVRIWKNTFLQIRPNEKNIKQLHKNLFKLLKILFTYIWRIEKKRPFILEGFY
jgi:hypothetical protein